MMKELFVARFLFLLGLTFTAVYGVTSPLDSALPTVAAATVKTERVNLAVEGMSCTSCASGVKAMLKRTPGVISAEVSYEKKEAVVDYDTEKTTREKIMEAINKLGYKASIKA